MWILFSDLREEVWAVCGQGLLERVPKVQIVNSLTQPMDFYIPPWFALKEGEQALEEKFFRAQALANPHTPLFSPTREVMMAKMSWLK
jgi:hypothetical protein